MSVVVCSYVVCLFSLTSASAFTLSFILSWMSSSCMCHPYYKEAFAALLQSRLFQWNPFVQTGNSVSSSNERAACASTHSTRSNSAHLTRLLLLLLNPRRFARPLTLNPRTGFARQGPPAIRHTREYGQDTTTAKKKQRKRQDGENLLR